ncbi:MAG: hypothetical protein OQK63_01165, partial [Ignavibacteriaceae bacterium]|nr:hypothetical protein [Ignavibacteriaceae bacterium]
MKTSKKTNTLFRLFYQSNSIVLLSLLFLAFIKCSDPKTEISSEQVTEHKNNVFGFCSDSLEQQSFSVQKYETLSDIFLNLGVAADSIFQIVNKSKEVIDERKIIAG